MTAPAPQREGVMSILGQVRSEAYRKGWSQAIMCRSDQDYQEGYENGVKDIASVRRKWFFIGSVCGVAAATLTGVFT